MCVWGGVQILSIYHSFVDYCKDLYRIVSILVNDMICHFCKVPRPDFALKTNIECTCLLKNVVNSGNFF